jgi:MFS family permease
VGGPGLSNQFALLRQRRFPPFFWTQLARFASGSPALAGVESGVLVNLAASLLILPFVLFSASAGQIADKYDKAALIRYIKAFEILVMAVAAWGFAAANLGVLLLAVFLTGTQAAVLGPIKYSVLPEVLRETELVGGSCVGTPPRDGP